MKKFCLITLLMLVVGLFITPQPGQCQDLGWINIIEIDEEQNCQITKEGKNILFKEDLSDYEIRYHGKDEYSGIILYPFHTNDFSYYICFDFLKVPTWPATAKNLEVIHISVYKKIGKLKADMSTESSFKGYIQIYLKK